MLESKQALGEDVAKLGVKCKSDFKIYSHYLQTLMMMCQLHGFSRKTFQFLTGRNCVAQLMNSGKSKGAVSFSKNRTTLTNKTKKQAKNKTKHHIPEVLEINNTLRSQLVS